MGVIVATLVYFVLMSNNFFLLYSGGGSYDEALHFKYNQQLMDRYRHLFRLTHNKVTRGVKHRIQQGRAVARTIIPKVKP